MYTIALNVLLTIYIYICAWVCVLAAFSLDQFAVGLAHIYYIGTAEAAAKPRSILPGEREKSWHHFNDLLLLFYTSGRSACQFSQLVGSTVSVCVCVCSYIRIRYQFDRAIVPADEGCVLYIIHRAYNARANNRSKRIKEDACFTVRRWYTVSSSYKRT